MHWKIKAWLQIILSKTKLGDYLNHLPSTFKRKHHYNVVLYQSFECIRKYNYSNTNLNENKTALEIGTGYSLISAIVLSLLGFNKIITVDITKDVNIKTLKKQIPYLKHPKILKLITLNSVFSETEILTKIETLENENILEKIKSLLNINYIAPYSFDEIRKQINKFNYISSQVVLEHIQPEILDQLFKFTKETLIENEFCVHTINFIDHFANPGIFQDKKISEFNFLKYSDKYWNNWSGNPIAYTNRLSFLYYLELCKKYNLKVVDFIGENYRERKELNHKLIHTDVIKKYNSIENIEDLTKFQRGTLIISKD